MFSKYYQSELAYLRDMGRLFSAANPTISKLLGERSADPDVERLLEGFAFLTARVRERIDDSVPEIVHALTELILPHYLRPVPGCSIVEFTPQVGALRERYRVTAGTELGAAPVSGTSCRFRTTADTDLLPATIRSVTLDESVTASPVLRLQLDCADKALAAVLAPAGVRLFIAEDLMVSSTLMLWLLRHCREVRIGGLNELGEKCTVPLPPTVIKAPGFTPAATLLPWPRLAPQGFRLLQEYFTLPEKFFFVDITGLDAARQLTGEHIEIAFQLERPPTLPAQLDAQSFRLHCVPVINLFTAPAVPMRTDEIAHEHLLKAADIDPAHMELYEVDSVTSLSLGQSRTTTYAPFLDFSHAAGDSPAAYYRVRRTASPIDGGLDAYLSLITPANLPNDEATLSIDAVWTNRFLPNDLHSGSISQPTAGSPAFANFRNIVDVTKTVRPPLGDELHWRLIAHLSLLRRSLVHAESLRALLALYNFPGLANQATGRANRMRAESIRASESALAHRWFEGSAVRGVRTRLDVQEDKFAGDGDAFLFGSVLDELFADHVEVNSFHELALRLLPSQREYTWQPRSGQKILI